jgi:hypothetical protein
MARTPLNNKFQNRDPPRHRSSIFKPHEACMRSELSTEPRQERSAMYTVKWDDFDNHGNDVIIGDQHLVGLPNNDPMPDGDLIYLTPEAGASFGVREDQIQIAFQTAPGVTWHKYVTATDGYAVTYGRIDLENQLHGPREVTVPATAPLLLLGKAKFVGTWTDMYRTPSPETYAGMRLNFYWAKD